MTSEVNNMWNNNNLLWIVLIILLIGCGGQNCGCSSTNSCSCGNSCDCCC